MTDYNKSLERIVNILNELRDKCPWDKKQTLSTLRPQTLEETYELLESIDNENWEALKEELGDVLLHILFYSKLAYEKGHFNIYDVIESLGNKLIHRHPHIYDFVTVKNENDVKKNWEKIKKNDGKNSILSGIPKSMPALLKAITIQKKVKQVGFDWENKDQVKLKIDEEIAEFNTAISQLDKSEMEEEMGDIFFSLINYSRFIGLDPEICLENTNQKFINRFKQLESIALENEVELTQLTLHEMESLWQEAKANIAKQQSK